MENQSYASQPFSNPSAFSAAKTYQAVALILYLICLMLQFAAGNMRWYQNGFAPIYLLMVIQLVPLAYMLLKGEFNYLVIILVSHALSYSLGKINILSTLQQFQLSEEGIFAVRQQTICTVLMTVGYIGIVKMLGFDYRNAARVPSFTEKACWKFLGVLFIWDLIPKFSILASPVLSFCASFILASITVSAARQSQAFIMRMAGALFFLGLVGYLRTGSLGAIVQIFSFIMLSLIASRRFKLGVTIGIPLILLVSIIQYNKSAYRMLLKGNENLSFYEKVSFVMMGITNTVQGVSNNPLGDEDLLEDEVNLSDALAAGFSRVGDDSLERVLTMTPSEVPYWMGRSYEFLFYFLVPRFIFPGKPQRDVWHEFGRVYRYLTDDDNETSISISYFAEAYMNFGFVGLYAFAFLIGLIIAGTETVARSTGKSQISPEYLLLLKPFEFLEQDFVSMVTVAVFIIIAIFLSKIALSSLNRSFKIFGTPGGGFPRNDFAY